MARGRPSPNSGTVPRKEDQPCRRFESIAAAQQQGEPDGASRRIANIPRPRLGPLELMLAPHHYAGPGDRHESVAGWTPKESASAPTAPWIGVATLRNADPSLILPTREVGPRHDEHSRAS